MTSMDKLNTQFQKLANYRHLSAICGWDQAAMMPDGGNEARARAMSELAVLCHETLTADEVGQWIADAEANSSALSEEQRVELREMKRQWLQASALPSDLVKAKSNAGSKCEHGWRTQRKANDWNSFAPNLKEVVKLSREEAQIRAEKTGLSPYNAMLDLYEPGMTTDKLDIIFGELKSWLPDLTKQIIEKQKATQVQQPQGPFDTEKQAALGKTFMGILGFDFNHGRLDVSMHPFCGGVPEDVRITTRYNEDDFTSAIMGVIHETGHARYEQGLPKTLSGMPSGEARSMGIHESQSLFFEMQLARNSAFVAHLVKFAKETFGRESDPAFAEANMDAIYKRVEPGYIRVDADEVTYPAHIILRYELERALIEGSIEVDDIPVIWNQKMQEYLNINTEGNYTNGCMQDIHWTDPECQMSTAKNHNYKDGCMQDIHWCDGSFGYFPSYTLGAMYAAQFMAAMRKTVDVDACIEALDFAPISAWLEANIWSKGSTLTTDELVIQATGEPLNPEYFKQHLIDRYLNN